MKKIVITSIVTSITIVIIGVVIFMCAFYNNMFFIRDMFLGIEKWSLSNILYTMYLAIISTCGSYMVFGGLWEIRKSINIIRWRLMR